MNQHRRQLRVHRPDVLGLDEVPRPTPGPRDVLVRVVVCGICGTDLGYLATGGLRGSGEQPMPLGHELSGVIDSIGDEVEDLRPGMRVVVNPDDDAIGNGGPEGGFATLYWSATPGRAAISTSFPTTSTSNWQPWWSPCRSRCMASIAPESSPEARWWCTAPV